MRGGYGHSSSANPNDLTMLTNMRDQQKQPVIKKYNKDEYGNAGHQDLHNQNPFLPGNIQKNIQNNNQGSHMAH